MYFAVRFDDRFCRKVMMTTAAIVVGSLFMIKPAAAQTTSTWTTCAQESQLCSFSGTRNVRYGANGTWVVRQVAASGGGAMCTNGVFGDPTPGHVKACQLESAVAPAPSPTPSGWSLCAREGALCSFTGTRRVRYGADTRWATRDVTASGGGVSCSNSVFGDPAQNTVKRCELAATTSGSTTQQPPTISGTPATSVSVGSTYRFQPTASDPNGNTLAFSITNRPNWATFNTTNGLLTGQPTLANVGAYSSIVIRVSDGISTVSLPAFAINVAQLSSGTAQLSWTPPTTNTNGSALTNLAGYRIYYGTSATALTQQIQIANPGIASYVVSGLTRGTYYFAVRAYNSVGAESVSSSQASKTIP
jgi:Putative Ig domain